MRIINLMMLVIYLSINTLLLSGCGQTGGLYLPDDKDKAKHDKSHFLLYESPYDIKRKKQAQNASVSAHTAATKQANSTTPTKR
ncbi:MAG: hypothetical protein Tsb005_04260 [Gammaproteobacteria bacterium]